MKLCLVVLLAVLSLFELIAAVRKFPPNFKFGVGSAAYQIEGGWDANGKGENIWDRLTHTTDRVRDGNNADITCDSYHKYKRDVEMLKELGVNFYRFSLSWSRIMPYGRINYINPDGIRYYNDVINELVANGIEPVATLYHWDLPQKLQDLGGWANSLIVDYFEEYARVAYEAFGDRIKIWLTFNQPLVFCLHGYGDLMAPSVNQSGVADYICIHNVLKSHARAYRLYDEMFRRTQGGKVSIALNSKWFEPDENTSREQADDAMQFEIGWLAHPIYSQTGDYPKIMKEKIHKRSIEQGYLFSRLPAFTSEEIEYIKGTSDFFGLNHYVITKVREMRPDEQFTENLLQWNDAGFYLQVNDTWQTTVKLWYDMVPWGFTKLLDWVVRNYDDPEIIIFENGFPNKGGLEDMDRINYFNLYLNALLDAIDQGANVTGYAAWTFMDAFEWLDGFKVHFGLYDVDHKDPNRTRTPKASAFYYRDVIANHAVD